jgi:hypothetical protein
VGVEPTDDWVTSRPPVLKTGTITGPCALPKKISGKRVPPDCGSAKSSGNLFSLRSVQYPEQVPARRVDHEYRVLSGIIIAVVADTLTFYSSLH